MLNPQKICLKLVLNLMGWHILRPNISKNVRAPLFLIEKLNPPLLRTVQYGNGQNKEKRPAIFSLRKINYCNPTGTGSFLRRSEQLQQGTVSRSVVCGMNHSPSISRLVMS